MEATSPGNPVLRALFGCQGSPGMGTVGRALADLVILLCCVVPTLSPVIGRARVCLMAWALSRVVGLIESSRMHHPRPLEQTWLGVERHTKPQSSTNVHDLSTYLVHFT
jgi:hypothetical protein